MALSHAIALDHDVALRTSRPRNTKSPLIRYQSDYGENQRETEIRKDKQRQARLRQTKTKERERNRENQRQARTETDNQRQRNEKEIERTKDKQEPRQIIKHKARTQFRITNPKT
jgi:hypothetical protein